MSNVFLQGAAYVEFDVHLSKDAVPIVYHDLACCISTKMVKEKRPVVLDDEHIKNDLLKSEMQCFFVGILVFH